MQAEDPSLAPRPGSLRSAASSARSRTTRRCCASVNSHDGPRLAALGTSCPDHFLRTKIQPAVRGLGPGERRRRGAEDGRWSAGSSNTARTTQAYYERCQRPDSPAMRDPRPDRRPDSRARHDRLGQEQERVARDRRVLQLRDRGHARGGGHRPYEAMDQQEAFDIEYWPLEEAKLQRMPPEKELDRQVIVVIGAGAGSARRRRTALVARRGARRLRRPGRGGGARRRRRRSSTATAPGSAWPDRASATAVRPSASAATSRTARA